MRRRAHVWRPPAVRDGRPGGRGSGAVARACPGAPPPAARARTAGPAASLSLLASALLLAGCAPPSPGTVDRLGARPRPPAGPTAAATARSGPAPAVPDDGRTGVEARQLLAVWDGWWQAQAAAYERGSRAAAALRLYSTGQALSGTLANLRNLQEAGMAMRGSPVNDARVTALDLAASPPTATVEDCLDVTGWHQVDARTKQPRDPRQRLTRYVVTGTARKSGDAWLVTRLTAQKGRTC